MIAAHGRTVDLSDLPNDMRAQAPVEEHLPNPLSADASEPLRAIVERATAQVERAYLHRVLHRHGGHLSRSAKAAGITRRTLYSKMKTYGLDAADYRS